VHVNFWISRYTVWSELARAESGMSIERVIVKNYRALASTDIRLRRDFNIIVGDNESGKSTLLEAINLALKCQINRRPAAYELHPYLFNMACVAKYIEELKTGLRPKPPEILVELYFRESSDLATLKGTNNSLRENAQGVSITICFDDDNYREEYRSYVADPLGVKTIPIEYYKVVWQDFAGDSVDARSMCLRSSLIDPGSISNSYAANKYIVEFTREYLTKEQQVGVALSYRKMRDVFSSDAGISKINEGLAKKKGVVSEKELSIAMDMSARAGWEGAVLPYLDEIPITLVGKGEQNSIKIKLAVEAALEAEKSSQIILIEEPENHLSHPRLNQLLDHIVNKASGKQLIVTTHSSFVLNKLGVENVLMFGGSDAITLGDLSNATMDYFKKLPGHDTLRMILAKRTILVEGPSDELLVQKAYLQKHGKTPLQDGVEVISVNALAFRRFLEIAKILKITASVITDNDGDVTAVKKKYAEYAEETSIQICFSADEKLETLEPHVLSVNGREKLNKVFGKSFSTKEALLSYMEDNKTECALRILESTEQIGIPKYIQDAVK
jgi:putative ATP-dependent endonuclease of the OLD family